MSDGSSANGGPREIDEVVDMPPEKWDEAKRVLERRSREPRKRLRLTIEVDEFWADDLDECAGYCSEPDPPGPKDRLHVVTEEWMRPDVVLTVCNNPGEKCMNDDFEMFTYKARIVGAEAVDRVR